MHGPTPVGRLRTNVVAMVAEVESDLMRARTRECTYGAKATVRRGGKRPRLSKSQEAHLMSLHRGTPHKH